jgi:hypothetical protein
MYIFIIYKASVSPGSVQQMMLYFGSLRYSGSLDTGTVVCLIADKFKPLIFSVTGFALSYVSNVFVIMILYDFCLLIWNLVI